MRGHRPAPLFAAPAAAPSALRALAPPALQGRAGRARAARARRARVRCVADETSGGGGGGGSRGSGGAPTGVLMVCLGNICRSPAAEAVLRGLAGAAGAGAAVAVDSCGTGGGSDDWFLAGGTSYHEGDASDGRMRTAAAERGIVIDSVSRPLRPGDFDRFRYIVAMDRANVAAVEDARRHWGVPRGTAKVVLLSEFSADEGFRGRPVPDPYWSGQDGFDTALDLIEEACAGLLEEVLRDRAEGE